MSINFFSKGLKTIMKRLLFCIKINKLKEKKSKPQEILVIQKTE